MDKSNKPIETRLEQEHLAIKNLLKVVIVLLIILIVMVYLENG